MDPTIPPTDDLGDDKPGRETLLDLYVLVLFIVAGAAVWIAFYNPRLAAAIGFGLLVLAALTRYVRRP